MQFYCSSLQMFFLIQNAPFSAFPLPKWYKKTYSRAWLRYGRWSESRFWWGADTDHRDTKNTPFYGKKLREVNEQIHYTGQYLANKSVYREFLNCKNKKKFQLEHQTEITLYETARKILKEHSEDGKLPSMKLLKAEKEKQPVRSIPKPLGIWKGTAYCPDKHRHISGEKPLPADSAGKRKYTLLNLCLMSEGPRRFFFTPCAYPVYPFSVVRFSLYLNGESHMLFWSLVFRSCEAGSQIYALALSLRPTVYNSKKTASVRTFLHICGSVL